MAGYRLGYFSSTNGEEPITGYWARGHQNPYRFAQKVAKEVHGPVNPARVEHLYLRVVDMHPEGEEIEFVDSKEGDMPVTVIRID